jgi:hypothetical protein
MDTPEITIAKVITIENPIISFVRRLSFANDVVMLISSASCARIQLLLIGFFGNNYFLNDNALNF